MFLTPPTLTAINKLKTNPNNPRAIRKNQLDNLVKSIREFPEMLEARPIVVDPDFVVLGGNMRLKAAQIAGLTEVPVYVASWEEAKHKEFIIKDNGHSGEWDQDMLANDGWDEQQLKEWGVPIDWDGNVNPDELGDEFSLADGEKEPFQSMTFTLADEQAEFIRNALITAQSMTEFKYIETLGNNNKNGNALYFLVSQWDEQKT